MQSTVQVKPAVNARLCDRPVRADQLLTSSQLASSPAFVTSFKHLIRAQAGDWILDNTTEMPNMGEYYCRDSPIFSNQQRKRNIRSNIVCSVTAISIILWCSPYTIQHTTYNIHPTHHARHTPYSDL
jgi:hypothetical protein